MRKLQTKFAKLQQMLRARFRKLRKKERKIPVGAIAFFTIGIAVALVCFYQAWAEMQAAQAAAQSLAQSEAAIAAPTPTPTPSSTPIPTVSAAEIPIDFALLQEMNEDVYAWIEIPDTEVNYPILQHESDDSYYLEHTIDHIASLPGAIYTEKTDGQDFSDFNTVIYGHNMANDTMFGSLSKYREEEGYLQEHRNIIIYTETEKRTYRIFAAVVYDNRYIPYVYDDDSIADRQAFLDSLYSVAGAGSIFLEDVAVTTQSQIITLSTCIGSMPNNRFLLVAVYVGEEDAIENLTPTSQPTSTSE